MISDAEARAATAYPWRRCRTPVREFDYEDMVALSGLFRLWALYSSKLSPEQRTEVIGYSADFEALAHWAGDGWRAADPSGAMPVFTLLARRTRNHSSVVNLEHAKHWLGKI